MESTSDPQLEKLITDCRNGAQLQSSAFIQYLGLPLVEGRGRPGPMQFRDDTGQLQRFNLEMMRMVKPLREHYGSKEALKQAAKSSDDTTLAKVTKLLSNYGPIIWGPSGQRLTVDENSLMYSRPGDQKKITECLYYLALHRAIRSTLSSSSSSMSETTARKTLFSIDKPDSVKRARKRKLDSHGTRGNTDADSSEDYNEHSSRRRALSKVNIDGSSPSATTNTNSVCNKPPASQPAPVASMLPARNRSINQETQHSVIQDLTQSSHLEKQTPRVPGDEVSIQSGGYRDKIFPYSDVTSRTIRRRGISTPDQIPLPTKTVRKDISPPGERTVNFPLLHNSFRKPSKETSPAMHSPPMTTEDTDHQRPSIEVSRERIITHDEDSVIGLSESDESSCLDSSQPPKGTRPSLIVRLELKPEGALIMRPNTPSSDKSTVTAKPKRDLLTSKLWHLFSKDWRPDYRDISSLQEVVTLVHTIRKDLRPGLEKRFGQDYEEKSVTLTQWLDILDHLVSWLCITKFSGQRAEMRACLKDLPSAVRTKAIGSFTDLRPLFGEWRYEMQDGRGNFSQNLASMLWELITLDAIAEYSDLLEGVMRFKRNLGEWLY